MAHEVDKMAYFGAVPWHGLGTAVNGAMSAEEALREGGLDFEVVKRPLWREFPDVPAGSEPFEKVDGAYCTVRTDRNEVLGAHVGDRYTIVQNHQILNILDPVVSRREAIYHTAGSLRGGAVTWLLAKLPGEIRVHGQDIVGKYVLLTNSHDGTSVAGAKLTPIRVVCMNTLRASLRGGLEYRIRHTANADQRMLEAAKLMGLANAYYAEFEEAAQAMARQPLDYKDTLSYLERCLNVDMASPDVSTRSKNMYSEALHNVEHGAGSDLPGVRGTVWGAYNAVTEWVDHRKYRDDNGRLANVWFDGGGTATKQRAFDEALALLPGRVLA